MYIFAQIEENKIGNEGMQVLSTNKHLPSLKILGVGNFLLI